MADKDSIDVLMTFIDTSNNGIDAESTTKWDHSDKLMDGFHTGKVFEVDDFTFGFGLVDSEGSSGRTQGGGPSSPGKLGDNSLHAPPGREHASATPDAARKQQSSDLFDKYIDSDEINFKVKPDVITVTKQVETSSIKFFDFCVNHKKFQKAILVKRKFTGKSVHEAFLRIEFTEPLVVGIEWDEGEVTREKLRFIHRGITVAYCPQDPNGKLGDPKPAHWTPRRRLAGGGSR